MNFLDNFLACILLLHWKCLELDNMVIYTGKEWIVRDSNVSLSFGSPVHTCKAVCVCVSVCVCVCVVWGQDGRGLWQS